MTYEQELAEQARKTTSIYQSGYKQGFEEGYLKCRADMAVHQSEQIGAELDGYLKNSPLKVEHPEDSALYVCGGYKPADEKVEGFRL